MATMMVINVWAVLLCLSRLQPVWSQNLPQLDAFAAALSSSSLWAGMIHVEQGGKPVFSKGYGQAVHELGVPMQNNHRYPIGSNTKLFTAVAVWQLHRAGKLNVYDPASKYMNSTELGLNGPWCPRAHNASSKVPCQTPQLQHLLRMSGGVIGFDDCEYKDTAWQQAYCLGTKGTKAFPNMPIVTMLSMQVGALSMADYLKVSGVLHMPLEFVPGAAYHYSNPGYTLAGYIVEKVSGMPIADYFRINIFDKAGLSSTDYDVTDGILGLHKGQLPYPAYISYIRQRGDTPDVQDEIAATAGVSISQFTASSGSPRFWGGDVRSNSSSSSAALLDGSAGTGVYYAMTAKYPGPSNFDWNVANTAGAISSTPQDLGKWFRALLVEPGHLGLGKDLLKEFLGLSTAVPGLTFPALGNLTLSFAQGLVVVKDPGHARGLGISHGYYLGSLGGFQAVVYVSLHPTDPSKDVFVNAMAATVLPEQSSWPAGAAVKNKQGGCGLSPLHGPAGNSSRSSSSDSKKAGRHLLNKDVEGLGGNGSAALSVSAVLCELTNNVPNVLKTVPDLLARKAVQELTGALWFGIKG